MSYCSVEVVHLRSNFSLVHFNIPLVCAIAVIWLILWFIMILEKLVYGRVGIRLRLFIYELAMQIQFKHVVSSIFIHIIIDLFIVINKCYCKT